MVSLGLYIPGIPGIRAREVIDVHDGIVTYAPHGSPALRLEISELDFRAWANCALARVVF